MPQFFGLPLDINNVWVCWLLCLSQNSALLPVTYQHFYRPVGSGSKGEYLNTMNVQKQDLSSIFCTSRANAGGYATGDMVNVITIGY